MAHLESIPDQERLERFIKRFRVEPGSQVQLQDYDPGYTGDYVRKKESKVMLAEGIQFMADLQDRFYAENLRSLLLVLQARDAAGKDSTIKHVMSGLNPQGTHVTSFKQPSSEELDHDYLWRIHAAMPERGCIGIFNRSHYEEVLVVRVHPEILASQPLPESLKDDGIWQRRFEEINNFEKHMVENGTEILKVFLHVSREEQRQRFLERIERPDKNWKFSAGDVKERGYWDDYTSAYEDCFSHTSTTWAPWYVVPADHKWFTRLVVGAIVVEKLMEMDPQYPTFDEAHRQELEQCRVLLEQEPGSS